MPVINIEHEDLNRILKSPISSEEFSRIIPEIGADPDEIDEVDGYTFELG